MNDLYMNEWEAYSIPSTRLERQGKKSMGKNAKTAMTLTAFWVS